MTLPRGRRWFLLAAATLLAAPARAADLQPELLSAGFSLDRPWPEAARRGGYDRTDFTLYSPGLAFWVDVAHLAAGDHLVLSLKTPDGAILAAQNVPVSRSTDRFFAFAGARRPSRGWQPGPHIGRIQVIRGDQILIEAIRQVALS